MKSLLQVSLYDISLTVNNVNNYEFINQNFYKVNYIHNSQTTIIKVIIYKKMNFHIYYTLP